MKIYLMRHGQTTGDVEDRYGGDYEDHLTQLGQEQAKTLVKEMENKGIEIIFSSPRTRAVETAQILSFSINRPFQIMNDWRERNHYGILTGIIKAEAKDKYPELVESLKDTHNTIPDGESYDSFKQRIERIFNQLSESKHSAVGVVTHGGPIRLIFREVLKLGEINISDCAWAELKLVNGRIELVRQKGIDIGKN